MTRKLLRQWTYPLAGVALGLGAPIGLAVLHAARQEALPSPAWLAGELQSHPGEYLYLTTAALLCLSLLGWFVGRQLDQLEAGALTDPLTGLWNRRYLDQRLSEEIRRASRHDSQLSLLLIDVDKLKDINDRGGHDAGDAALALVSRAIAASCRATDVPARFGGDEFAVLAPSTPGADAVGLAERIRAALTAARPGDGHVSVSIGVADLADAPSLDAGELCRAADKALYTAKASGRDGVARCTDGSGEDARVIPILRRLPVCVRLDSPDGPGPTAAMHLSCPETGRPVSVALCLACPRWKGLFLDPKGLAWYLKCTRYCVERQGPDTLASARRLRRK